MSGRVLNGKMLQLPGQRVGRTKHLSSWDESSSISSGLSDGSDNLSSEEFNASSSLNSLPATPIGSRLNSGIVLHTDAEKGSLVESGLSWYSEDAKCMSEGCYDRRSLKNESTCKWRKVQDDTGIKGELRKPQTLSHQNGLKKSCNLPVGITSPITQNPQSLLKAPGAKSGQKVVGKARMPVKASALQRSCSDAEKEQSQNCKPISGLVRPSAGSSNSFGFKKPAPVTGAVTALTPNGSVISVASTNTSKTLKSSAIPVKPSSGGISSSCKTSLDVSNCDQGFLAPNSRNNILYRSLPRPAKSSTLSLSRSKLARPVSSSIDGGLLCLKTVVSQSKLKEPGSGKSSGQIAAEGSGSVNQTDKEKKAAKAKAVVSDSECGSSGALKHGPAPPTQSIAKPPTKLLGLRQSSNMGKYSDLRSPNSPRETEGQTCSSPLLYPRISGLHCSMESLPLQMSVCPAGVTVDESRPKQDSGSNWSPGSSASLTLTMDSTQRDRNTLPKKELSRNGFSQSDEDCKERRHSHTIMSLSATDNGLPQLPSPTLTSKIPLTSIDNPGMGIPRMTRSNSIPTHETSFELYQASQLGSTLSIAERPKTVMFSGSFRDRDPGDDVHGSVLSLASSASSNYSSAEERMQGEQIRKLRRELECSQDKVASLTSQLSANANLVAAFEESLTLMTNRLQTLSASAEQKDSELVELRETIEHLKSKNIEAQAVIQGALNNPDVILKELRIKRQNSSESITSLNSITSHSSVGSLKEDAKKKKKKNWLRNSFGKAFSIKKGTKSGFIYSDIEEITTPDTSVPSSAKPIHEADECVPMSLQSTLTNSSSLIYEGNEEQKGEEKAVSELRSELWEKEMKLTDIRLEALNSAHQLEQLREAMNNMQVTVENLKAENDQLKTGSAPSSLVFPFVPPSPTSQPSRVAAMIGCSQVTTTTNLTKSFSLHECFESNTVTMEALSLSSPKDEVQLRVVIHLADQQLFREQVKSDFYIGSVRIDSRTDWATLDTVMTTTFQNYISQVDPRTCMGLSIDSIHSYSVNQVKRVLGAKNPENPPSHWFNKGHGLITMTLKGFKDKCVDSIVFETLIPKSVMQHYISLLLKHRRLILSGPSGTGKTYLASRLADYLLERSGLEAGPGHIITFNMHQQTCKELQLYLSNLANQIDCDCEDTPLVIVLDDVSDAASISELVNSALTCKYHKCPYIIGTTNQPVKMSSNHGLHLSFRMIIMSNNVDPVNGFLSRYLHRKLIEVEDESALHHTELQKVLDWVPKLWYHLHTFLEKHSTSDFLIGPCFFLSCPVTIAEFRSWFIDLWNQSIIPYLQEGAKDGTKLRVHSQKAVWEDPVEWVRSTLPWPSAQQDQVKLFHLPPPTAGLNTATQQPNCDRPNKATQSISMNSDPLIAMLLKLQESANFIETPEMDISEDPNFQATL
ncbi:neuron navigator 1 isoform X2 [Salminus brasiliensis]|uniref:neuron navigator 1 isoform X2 n=1 Tax=Salminus brasiliensis TaxID=930266 RepID=UPI003B83146A